MLVGVAAAAVVLGPLGWFWQQSLLPDTYSVMDMGYMDYGGGPKEGHAHGHHDGATDITTFTADPDRPADVSVDLVTRKTKDGYTINGSTPGPTITAQVGQLVEVHVRNASVDDGVSVHWHGVDVPNSQDGVAGVTQDAIGVGKEFTYRFVVTRPGTYWYHSHQVSHEQVIGGLLGALVVEPRRPITQDVDQVAVAHTYKGRRTINGEEGVQRVAAEPGDHVRVRVVNTDNGTVSAWASAPYTVLAIDGTDLVGPTPVDGRHVPIPAGGRADLEVTVPTSDAVRVQVGLATALVVGPRDAPVPDRVAQPKKAVDFLTYGTHANVPIASQDPDRSFEYSIGKRPGFLDGKPGLWWTINGHLYPDIPMFVVSEGDVVRVHIDNHSGDVHPMHLHGHHALLLSREGKRSTGSPIWVDSVDVEDGETVDLAFVADNPGVWMDHCHNLPHATQGLVSHLMYAGVTTPFDVGGDTGNTPE